MTSENREGTGSGSGRGAGVAVSVREVSPGELRERMVGGERVRVLDVRTPVEHAAVHVPGVELVPLDRLDGGELARAGGFPKDEPVYLLCRSGVRARRAAERLLGAGYRECVVVEGGTAAWEAAGYPVARGGPEVISLERQMRIAAGLLVVVGVVLGRWVDPGFVWLAAFVGAGLVFAGITDRCGMAMLLAKMPWNRVGVTAAAATPAGGGDGGGACPGAPPAPAVGERCGGRGD